MTQANMDIQTNPLSLFDGAFNTVPEQAVHDQPRPRIEHNRRKTFGQTIRVVGAIALVGTLATTGTYIDGWVTELGPHTTVDGNILAPGEASIEEVSLDVPTVPIATAKTKVGKVEVGMTKNVTAINGLINFPYENTTLERTATVETTININPSKVRITFDALTNKLTFTVPSDMALTSELNIPPGKGKTVDGTAFKLDSYKDLLSGAAGEISGLMKMLGDKDAGASKIAIIGGVAGDEITTHSELENFADLAIVNGVGDKCTNLVTEMPGFTKGMKENIIKGVRGILLDPNFTDNHAHKDLALLVNRPVAELQKMVSNATVELGQNYKIGPDQQNIDDYKAFLKSKFFKANLGKSAISCAVDKNVTFIKSDGTVSKGAKK